jgi:uncharacterized protein (TIGR03435 family)
MPLCGLNGAAGTIRAGGAPMTALALALGDFVDRQVLDRTGLVGRYVFTLRLRPDPPLPADAAASETTAAAITAVRQQLRLKLESTRAPLDTLVIDSIERPSDN